MPILKSTPHGISSISATATLKRELSVSLNSDLQEESPLLIGTLLLTSSLPTTSNSWSEDLPVITACTDAILPSNGHTQREPSLETRILFSIPTFLITPVLRTGISSPNCLSLLFQVPNSSKSPELRATINLATPTSKLQALANTDGTDGPVGCPGTRIRGILLEDSPLKKVLAMPIGGVLVRSLYGPDLDTFISPPSTSIKTVPMTSMLSEISIMEINFPTGSSSTSPTPTMRNKFKPLLVSETTEKRRSHCSAIHTCGYLTA